MMPKGKILKVRIGHEANCSSGMIALFLLYSGAFTYLPLSVISAALQANAAVKERPSWKSGIALQIIGVFITILLGIFALNSGYDESTVWIAILMGAAFAFSIWLGGRLAHKIRYWNLLAVPVTLVASLGVFLLVLRYTALLSDYFRYNYW